MSADFKQSEPEAPDSFMDDDGTLWADRRGALLDALEDGAAEDAVERRRSMIDDWHEAFGQDAP